MQGPERVQTLLSLFTHLEVGICLVHECGWLSFCVHERESRGTCSIFLSMPGPYDPEGQDLRNGSLLERVELMEHGIIICDTVVPRPCHKLGVVRSPSPALGFRGPKGHTSVWG